MSKPKIETKDDEALPADLSETLSDEALDRSDTTLCVSAFTGTARQ